MDSQGNSEISSLSLERQFHLEYIRQNLGVIPRDQLEELLINSLTTLSIMTQQLKVLEALLLGREGKI